MIILVVLISFIINALAPSSDQVSTYFLGKKFEFKPIDKPHFTIREMDGTSLPQFLAYLACKGEVDEITQESQDLYAHLLWGLVNHQSEKVKTNVLTELVDNAVDATKEMNQPSIDVALGKGFLQVKNDGIGISLNEIDRVLLPYNSSKKLGEDIGRFGQGLKSVFYFLRKSGDKVRFRFQDTDSGDVTTFIFEVKKGMTVSPSDSSYLKNITVTVFGEDPKNYEQIHNHTEKKVRRDQTVIDVESSVLTEGEISKLKERLIESYHGYIPTDTSANITYQQFMPSGESSIETIGFHKSTVQSEGGEGKKSWRIESVEEKKGNGRYVPIIFTLKGRTIFECLSNQVESPIIVRLPSALSLNTQKNTLVVDSTFYDAFFAMTDELYAKAKEGSAKDQEALWNLIIHFGNRRDENLREAQIAFNIYVFNKYRDLKEEMKDLPKVEVEEKEGQVDGGIYLTETVKLLGKEMDIMEKGGRDYQGAPVFDAMFEKVLNFFEGGIQMPKSLVLSPHFTELCTKLLCAYDDMINKNGEASEFYRLGSDKALELEVSSLKFKKYSVTLITSLLKIISDIKQKTEKDSSLDLFLGRSLSKFQEELLKLQESIKNEERLQKENQGQGYRSDEERTNWSVPLNPVTLDSSISKFLKKAKQKAHSLSELKPLMRLYGNTEIIENRIQSLDFAGIKPINALAEVITNSIEAKASQVDIESGLHEDNIMIKVKDNGKGIKDPLSVLIPFQSTKTSKGDMNFGWGIYQSLTVFNQIVIVSLVEGKKVEIYLYRDSQGKVSYHYEEFKTNEEGSYTEVYLFQKQHKMTINQAQLARDFKNTFPIQPEGTSVKWKGCNLEYLWGQRRHTLIQPVFLNMDLFLDVPEITEKKKQIIEYCMKEGWLERGYLTKKVSPSELIDAIQTVIGQQFSPQKYRILVLRVREMLSLRKEIVDTQLERGYIARGGVVSPGVSEEYKRRYSQMYINYPSLISKSLEGSEILINREDLEKINVLKIKEFFKLLEASQEVGSMVEVNKEIQNIADGLSSYILDSNCTQVLPTLFAEGWHWVEDWKKLDKMRKKAVYYHLRKKRGRLEQLFNQVRQEKEDNLEKFKRDEALKRYLDSQLQDSFDLICRGDQHIVSLMEKVKEYESYITDWSSLKKRMANALCDQVYDLEEKSEGEFFQFVKTFFIECNMKRDDDTIKGYINDFRKIFVETLEKYLDVYWYYFEYFQSKELMNGKEHINSRRKTGSIYKTTEVDRGFIELFEEKNLKNLKVKATVTAFITKDGEQISEINKTGWAEQIRSQYPLNSVDESEYIIKKSLVHQGGAKDGLKVRMVKTFQNSEQYRDKEQFPTVLDKMIKEQEEKEARQNQQSDLTILRKRIVDERTGRTIEEEVDLRGHRMNKDKSKTFPKKAKVSKIKRLKISA